MYKTRGACYNSKKRKFIEKGVFSANYNIDFDLAAFVIALFTIYCILNKKGLQITANRFYFSVCLCSLISTISDLGSAVANINHAPYALQDFWNYLYLTSHSILAMGFVLFILSQLRFTLKMRPHHWVLVSLPAAVQLAVIISNPISHLAFAYSETGAYERGPLYVVLYACGFLYMLTALVLSCAYREMLTKKKSMPLLFMPVLMFIPVILQFYFPHILLENFFQATGLLGILYSIEDRIDAVDPVTNLGSRYSFLDNIQRLIARGEGVVVVVKPGGLRYYSSTMGTAFVDEVKWQIARWLEAHAPAFRCFDCGGGVFALYTPATEIWGAVDLMGAIRRRFNKYWGPEDYHVLLPVQLARIDLKKDVTSTEELMAILEAPYEGTSSETLDAGRAVEGYRRYINVERMIRNSLENRGFLVYYQPIWSREKGAFTSAEALVRLQGEEGLVLPDEFIPIAERNGSIHAIGAFVFEEVCRFYREQRLNELGVEYIEINLSVAQCVNRKLASDFQDILKKHGLAAEHINLEITESATANPETLRETARSLTGAGFSLSLDDYGTGYSNLSLIHEIPFRLIKLDKSLLWSAMSPNDGSGSLNAKVLLGANIQMIRAMSFQTLVEGVETEEQKQMLVSQGCDYLQGYLFSRPIPPQEFVNFLREHRAPGNAGR